MNKIWNHDWAENKCAYFLSDEKMCDKFISISFCNLNGARDFCNYFFSSLLFQVLRHGDCVCTAWNGWWVYKLAERALKTHSSIDLSLILHCTQLNRLHNSCCWPFFLFFNKFKLKRLATQKLNVQPINFGFV